MQPVGDILVAHRCARSGLAADQLKTVLTGDYGLPCRDTESVR